MSLEIADIAEVAGYEVTGFVENHDRQKAGGDLEDKPVLWIDDATRLVPTHQAICGLATTSRHIFTDQAAALGFGFATVVHPAANVSAQTSVGPGCVIGAGAVIGAYSRLGQHVLVNRGSLIGHHTTIGDYVSIQPGANVAGACVVSDRAWISIGAIVIDRITIGSDTLIGAGSVVVADVPDNVVVFGSPARVTKDGFSGR